MPLEPIYNVMAVLRNAVHDALDPLTANGVYWQQAAQNAALPFCIFQSQDLGGRSEKRIEQISWSGLIVVKALASDQGAAETLIATVAPGMENLSASGYTIQAVYDKPVVVPPNNGIWQACHQWRVYIEAN